jgi:hypothetical protein
LYLTNQFGLYFLRYSWLQKPMAKKLRMELLIPTLNNLRKYAMIAAFQ